MLQDGQSSYMSESDSALSPAQEHVSDALAAFDAGHLQEAQNAFDLSVWADVKSDKGESLSCNYIISLAD